MRYLEIRSKTPGGATCAFLSESYTNNLDCLELK